MATTGRLRNPPFQRFSQRGVWARTRLGLARSRAAAARPGDRARRGSGGRTSSVRAGGGTGNPGAGRLEHPLVVLRQVRLLESAKAVPVPDRLEVPVRVARTVPLVRRREVDVDGVLRLVRVEDRVALVVVALRDQPAEDARWVRGVGLGDPGVVRLPNTLVTLSRVIERQWMSPESLAVQRSMRAKSPSTRGR